MVKRMEKYKLIMRIIATVIMIIAITLYNITDSNLPILFLMVLGVSAAEAALEVHLESECKG